MARPSHTALRIARGVLTLARDPELSGLLPPATADTTKALLVGAGLLTERHQTLLQSDGWGRFAGWVEQHTLPGASLHGVLRKRWVDDSVEAAIAAGATQVLVVGAGFDTLGLRRARQHPEVRFVEVDQAGTMEAKQRGAAAAGLLSDNLRLVSADLTTTGIGEALPRSWDEHARSVVVAEGVLMYLSLAAVKAFLDTVAARTAQHSQLVFTALLRSEDGNIPIPKSVQLSLKAMGEPLGWCPHRDELVTLLEAHGHRLIDFPSHADLNDRYLADASLAGAPLAMIEALLKTETT